MFKKLPRSMKAVLNFHNFLNTVDIDNVIKQGNITIPTLFSIYYAITLFYAFYDCDIPLCLRLRTMAEVFNLRILTWNQRRLWRYFRFWSLLKMQTKILMHPWFCSQEHASLLGMPSVSRKKAGTRLDVVVTFVYLNSSLFMHVSLEPEIQQRMMKPFEN